MGEGSPIHGLLDSIGYVLGTMGLFVLYDLLQAFDAEVRKARRSLVARSEDMQAAIFGNILIESSNNHSSSSPSISATRAIVKTWLIAAMIKPRGRTRWTFS